ncbi:hypothetical protein A3K82_00380 [Candidatus Pacearchaeota archaeon RBG_19FT_COMBO_34_9]|nr:MAG: hypothetical protein A3K82_00380 [Candidatus Pacearchaeota archaeon RBG_19FT_COMBO_34_9]OGJ16223.1 MAG: hypothetical protein A3K74_03290 [Candidatus Pacearchaeota archaeon RBG_13_33_26]
MGKLFVLGIDGAFPEYFFGEWLDELPNIKKIIENGGYARLNSTIPPLSVVAWSSIYTGKSPADTGIFEYIYRKNFSYGDIHVITSQNLKEKTVWQIASENDKKSIVCYLNLTWPIKPFNGYLIGDPLAPSGESVQSTYPKELKGEIQEVLGEFPSSNFSEFRDTSKNSNFREIPKKEVIKGIYNLTEKQIEVMKYIIKNKQWDLFFGVIGTSDRMNHAFWRYMDNEHRKYEKGSEFENTLKDYYRFIDEKLGELISLLDKDTKIIILSDHGITRMHTRVNLTDWLIREGYMVLKEPIKEKSIFNPEMVDWKKTKVFAIGAYEGQIFINLKGREPEGIIEKEDYDRIIEELAEKLKQIRGDNGKLLDTKIFKKKDYFDGKCEEIAPDIIVYFDNLHYGCNNSLIGNETLWSPNTAKGSDDACHSRQGIFIIKNGVFKNKNIGEIDALDVAPTILNELGIKTPEDMKGKIIK